MWGMGNRSEPSGPDETSERSLFKVLEAKNANRSGSAGLASCGYPSLLGPQGALALRGCGGYRHRVRGDPVRLQREPGYLRLRARRQRRPRRCDDTARRLGDVVQRERSVDRSRQRAGNGRSSPTASVPPTRASPAAGRRTRATSRAGAGAPGSPPPRTTSPTPMRPRTSSRATRSSTSGRSAIDTQAGDANMGFWFLQDPTVGPNASGGFDGKHVDGDILDPELADERRWRVRHPRLQVGGIGHSTEITGLDRGRLRRRQARHDERVRLREHGHDHASLGRRSEVAVLLRGRAQSERALPGSGASVLLDLHLEHAHVTVGRAPC